jgi:pantetheine-phosphate adenylyltransferase
MDLEQSGSDPGIPMNIQRRTAIYPGTFDPITNGHVDLIRRASSIFDHLIIAVGHNPEKKTLFSVDERLAMVRASLAEFEGVTVEAFTGLLAEFAASKKATAIVRGLRVISDFEFEFQMALMNRRLAPGIETVYLMPNEKYTYLSSTIIKDVARNGGDVSRFVPQPVIRVLSEKFAR